MNHTCRQKTATVMVVALVGLALGLMARRAASQNCCVDPSSEISTNDGRTSGTGHAPTITKFNMTISNGSTVFDGRVVREWPSQQQGSNTCWYSGAPSAFQQYPAIPTSPISRWTVAGGSVSGQSNHWGWDGVGLTSDLIDQVRNDLPDVYLGCLLTVHQDMFMDDCSSGSTLYEQNNILTIYFTDVAVRNCRNAVLDSIYRCDDFLY